MNAYFCLITLMLVMQILLQNQLRDKADSLTAKINGFFLF